jgi:ArsR family transcriptional regulator
MTMINDRDPGSRLTPGQFDRIAKALSDPRRFALLQAIAEHDECPYQKLCQDFPVSKATISHHMKELVRAGLIEAERDGQYMHARIRGEVVEAYSRELGRRLGTGTAQLK